MSTSYAAGPGEADVRRRITEINDPVVSYDEVDDKKLIVPKSVVQSKVCSIMPQHWAGGHHVIWGINLRPSVAELCRRVRRNMGSYTPHHPRPMDSNVQDWIVKCRDVGRSTVCLYGHL